MRHRLTSIDNMLRGVLFGGLLAAVAAVIALVLANTNTVPLLTVRAGDPGYTPTASDTVVLPPPVRTDIPAGMLSVPVETGQALATMQAAFGPYASQTAFIIPAATVPQPNAPSTQTLP